MDTIKVPFKNVKMVAHRGVSSLEKENSMAAFIAAGNRSYYGIECDIHATLDGKYVVLHDADTLRVAGVSLNVENAPFEEVRKVKLLDINGKPRGDLTIPTLQEYLSVCHRYHKVSVLELKSNFTVEQLNEIIQIIQNEGHLEETVFISFILENLIQLRKLLPKQPLQYLTGEFNDELVKTLRNYQLDLDIHHSQITAKRVSALHEMGILVNCWTVDNLSDAVLLQESGVDFITSNVLE